MCHIYLPSWDQHTHIYRLVRTYRYRELRTADQRSLALDYLRFDWLFFLNRTWHDDGGLHFSMHMPYIHVRHQRHNSKGYDAGRIFRSRRRNVACMTCDQSQTNPIKQPLMTAWLAVMIQTSVQATNGHDFFLFCLKGFVMTTTWRLKFDKPNKVSLDFMVIILPSNVFFFSRENISLLGKLLYVRGSLLGNYIEEVLPLEYRPNDWQAHTIRNKC